MKELQWCKTIKMSVRESLEQPPKNTFLEIGALYYPQKEFVYDFRSDKSIEQLKEAFKYTHVATTYKLQVENSYLYGETYYEINAENAKSLLDFRQLYIDDVEENEVFKLYTITVIGVGVGEIDFIPYSSTTNAPLDSAETIRISFQSNPSISVEIREIKKNI